MASIKKLPTGRYQARYRCHGCARHEGQRKEHAQNFVLRRDAQQWLDEEAVGLVTGRYVDPRGGRMTFMKYFTEWAERQVWAEGTRTSAALAADSTTFGSVPMRDLRRSHFEIWVKDMDTRGLAPTTIRTRTAYVAASIKAAVRDRVIAENPSDGVKLPRLRRSEIAMEIPTIEQVRAALDTAPEHFRAFVAVAAFAGLRLGEAAGLQVGDVDWIGRVIRVRRQIQGNNVRNSRVVPPKAGSERDVFVPEKLVKILARHIEQVGTLGEEQWLFQTFSGTVHNRASAGDLWRRTREPIGMHEFTLHDLRHFFASALIAAGCDVVTVQRALGHSQPSITLNTYSHLWPSAEDKTRAAAEGLMDEVLADPADDLRTTKGS